MLARRYTFKIPEEHKEFPRHGVVKQDLRTRSSGRVLVQRILRQVRAIRSVSMCVPQFDDGEVEMVVFGYVDEIFAHAQATRGSPLNLENRLK